MRINASDETFTVRDIINEDFDGVSDAYPAYGMAFGCSALTTGRFSIDLTGTGFYIPNTVRSNVNEEKKNVHSPLRIPLSFLV